MSRGASTVQLLVNFQSKLLRWEPMFGLYWIGLTIGWRTLKGDSPLFNHLFTSAIAIVVIIVIDFENGFNAIGEQEEEE